MIALFVYIQFNFFNMSKREWNYMELIVLNKDNNIDLGKKEFASLYNACSEKYKIFDKNLSRYFYDDLIYEICNNEVKVYSKQSVNLEKENGIMKTMYLKDKKPYYMFGSTQKINNKQIVSCSIIRLHNNVYLNFEVIEFPHLDKVIYKVYLNYNHEEINDLEHIQNKVNDFQKIINKNRTYDLHFNLSYDS